MIHADSSSQEIHLRSGPEWLLADFLRLSALDPATGLSSITTIDGDALFMALEKSIVKRFGSRAAKAWFPYTKRSTQRYKPYLTDLFVATGRTNANLIDILGNTEELFSNRHYGEKKIAVAFALALLGWPVEFLCNGPWSSFLAWYQANGPQMAANFPVVGGTSNGVQNVERYKKLVAQNMATGMKYEEILNGMFVDGTNLYRMFSAEDRANFAALFQMKQVGIGYVVDLNTPMGAWVERRDYGAENKVYDQLKSTHNSHLNGKPNPMWYLYERKI